MVKRIFLWATVLSLCFHFTGHIYENIVLIPNWKSGEVADVVRYVDFLRAGSPGDFFSIAQLICLLFSLITLILVWKEKGNVRIFAGTTLLISIIVAVGTYFIFLPINKYMGTTKVFDPVELKTMVSTWINFEYLRVLLIGIGLAASIAAFEAYSKRRTTSNG